MESAIRIIIPGVPVPQGRPRFRNLRVGDKQIVTTYDPALSRKEKERIRRESSYLMKKNGYEMLEEAVALTLQFFIPIPKSYSNAKHERAISGSILPITKPDLDNYVKLILDALNGMLFKDDSMIVSINASKRYSRNPGTIIEAKPANPHSQQRLFADSEIPINRAKTTAQTIHEIWKKEDV